MTASNSLHPLLRPESIAILGASSDFSKVNGRPLRFLLEKGYRGRIYPINPKYQTLGKLRCYGSILETPEPADLAIVALPAQFVTQAVRDLGAHGVRSAVVFSSGFSEMGEDGRRMEREVAAAARDAGVRLCGPNCLGLINAFDRVIATFAQFADGDTPPGPIGFVTQSGAFGTAIAALARRRDLGLGYFVNTGNEADVNFVHVMTDVLDDERIRIGAGYIEGLKDGAGLAALAQRAMAAGKPLVLTKVGRSDAGARAAASHTGSLAGEDRVFDGVVRQFGIIRARNEEHMLDIVEVFACCGIPEGNGIGIITQSGGAGVLMADRADELGLETPVLGAATRAALAKVIPGFGVTANPVDVTGQFVAQPELLRDSVRIVLDDPQVHAGIVWLQLMDAHVDVLVRIFEEIKAQASKPFVVCWVAASDRAVKLLHERGIAVLRGAEPAVDAVRALVQYGAARRQWLADRAAREQIELPTVNLPQASGIVPTLAAARLLRACGVTTAECALATTAAEAQRTAEQLGYPVALKIESPDIAHKTDAHGVALDLQDAAAVERAFAAIVAAARRFNADARIDGVIVQKMANRGIECVIGLKHDPVFGPVVMAGLGGIFIEVLKDVAFRRAPVTDAEALAMLDELSGRAILDGVRGKPPADRAALARLIAAVSRFGTAAGGRLRELDVNPVIVDAAGAAAVDWLMVLD
jgi:acetyltransferase